MEYNDLVLEVVRRVNDKLADAELNGVQQRDGSKPKLLVAAQEDDARCQAFRSDPGLLARFEVGTSFSQSYAGDVGEYSFVVLFNMDNCSLAKIADGGWDDPYTDTAVRAILLGKRLFLPKEEIEIYRYLPTAPKAYYEMFLKKLELLERSNVTICGYDWLIPLLVGQLNAGAPAAAPSVKEHSLDKRVVTERDLSAARAAGAAAVRVGARAIVTDLAKDYARANGIAVMRG